MSEKLTAPRGTADFFPPESTRWSELEARMHLLAARYGYGEVRTPLFEATELFVRGVGEQTDIVSKEMYTFADRGGRSLTLRPEWTAPVVRAALEHHLFATGPLRLYYVGPIFRYERPQKGRYRQSHQFGVECFGFAGPEADLEVIALAWQLVESYGIRDAVLNLNSLGDAACRPKYRQALLEHFSPHLHAMSPESRARRRCARFSARPAANTLTRCVHISNSPAFRSSSIRRSCAASTITSARSSRSPRVSWARRAAFAAGAGTTAWSPRLAARRFRPSGSRSVWNGS